MTSDPIRAAIEQLRASREALTEGFRGQWTVSRTADYVVPVADAEEDRSYYVVAHAPICASHIALTASPHVTEALIALLVSASKYDEAGNPGEWLVSANHLHRCARALATAITRRDS